MDAIHSHFMQQAIALGRRGLGRTAPNPAVGCVIVAGDDSVLATGWTQDGGRPHAETHALAQLKVTSKDALKNARAYVTLEPCAHHGQTGPCAEALIKAGIGRVFVGNSDPDSRVAGKGIALLRDAGVEVQTDVCAIQAADLHQGFFNTIEHQRPMVTLKLATSADGFMRTPEGQSPWITGSLARQYGHLLRAQHDAILTGAGTLHNDNPSLDCRLPGMAARSPLPVVMSHRTQLPVDCKLAARAEAALFYTDAGNASLDGFEVVAVETLTPEAVLRDLAARGITRVLLECGPVLAKSFLDAGLVDTVAHFKAPHKLALAAENDMSSMGLDLASGFERQVSLRLGVDGFESWQRRDNKGAV